MTLRCLVAMCILVTVSPSVPVSAQDPLPDPARSEAYAAGFVAGDSVAGGMPVSGGVGRLLGGALGGALLGPAAFFTLGGHPEALLPGAGLAVFAAEVRPAPPPPAPFSAAHPGPDYGAGFEAGFEKREAAKRRRLTYGAAGVAAAASFTYLLLLVLGPGYT